MHWQTHTVFNQPPALNNSNLFLSDRTLADAVKCEGAAWDAELLASIGQQLGSAESMELGRLANVNPPELLRYGPTGERLDDVRFHPAWHLLLQGLCANRVHNLAWQDEAHSGLFVARAARFVLYAQVEAGSLCPITMTFAAIPLLQQALPSPFANWLTPLFSDRYDPHMTRGGLKRGILIGMGMTEKQGGSDVFSNTTRAFSVALYHALHRQAFGKKLVDQPIMRDVLSRMALQLEGQTAFLFRLARAWDHRANATEVLWARLFTPVAKFAVCKAGIPFVAKAMEVLGGSVIAKRASCQGCTVKCR